MTPHQSQGWSSPSAHAVAAEESSARTTPPVEELIQSFLLTFTFPAVLLILAPCFTGSSSRLEGSTLRRNVRHDCINRANGVPLLGERDRVRGTVAFELPGLGDWRKF